MMGETDLEKLILNMKPELNEGEYVFCTVENENQPTEIKPLGTFIEKEGTTLILSKTQADNQCSLVTGSSWVDGCCITCANSSQHQL